MTRGPQQDGFALLVVLIPGATACLLLAATTAAIIARQGVFADDIRGARAKRHASIALADFCDSLRWAPRATRGTPTGTFGDGSWTASWEPLPSTRERTTVKLNVTSRVLASRASLEAYVALAADSVAQGVVVSGSVNLGAPTGISGSGLYVGGDISGRDFLSFGSSSAGASTLDSVHGRTWPLAAAHAAGEIRSAAGEIHLTTQASQWPLDTDRHTADEHVVLLTAPPAEELLDALREHAASAGTFSADELLDLSDVATGALGQGLAADAPILVVLAPAGTEVRIRGSLPASSAPIVLVVLGNAEIGEPGGSSTRFAGSIVVTGTLAVRGPSHLDGHLYARQLNVAAPLAVDVPHDWLQRTLPGLTAPTIVALSDGLP